MDKPNEHKSMKITVGTDEIRNMIDGGVNRAMDAKLETFKSEVLKIIQENNSSNNTKNGNLEKKLVDFEKSYHETTTANDKKFDEFVRDQKDFQKEILNAIKGDGLGNKGIIERLKENDDQHESLESRQDKFEKIVVYITGFTAAIVFLYELATRILPYILKR